MLYFSFSLPKKKVQTSKAKVISSFSHHVEELENSIFDVLKVQKTKQIKRNETFSLEEVFLTGNFLNSQHC